MLRDIRAYPMPTGPPNGHCYGRYATVHWRSINLCTGGLLLYIIKWDNLTACCIGAVRRMMHNIVMDDENANLLL
jgi:hypothetical protein